MAAMAGFGSLAIDGRPTVEIWIMWGIVSAALAAVTVVVIARACRVTPGLAITFRRRRETKGGQAGGRVEAVAVKDVGSLKDGKRIIARQIDVASVVGKVV